MTKWDDYTKVQELMFERTHTDQAPWVIVRSNDKGRARLAVIRRILQTIPYEDRDLKAIGKADAKIIGEGTGFLKKAAA